MRRDPAMSDNSLLPAAFQRIVGDKVYQGLWKGYRVSSREECVAAVNVWQPQCCLFQRSGRAGKLRMQGKRAPLRVIKGGPIHPDSSSRGVQLLFVKGGQTVPRPQAQTQNINGHLRRSIH